MEKESLKISFIQIAINVPTAITKPHFYTNHNDAK